MDLKSPDNAITLFPKQDNFIYSPARYAGYGGGFG
jgi:hypothetical protein